MPRGGNAGGGGQPGWILKCKGWETDPNAYIYFTVQGHAWAPICDALGKPEWKDDPAYNTPKARQPHIMDIFATIEDFIKDKTKFEAVDIFRKFDIPCAPVLSMKELLHDKSPARQRLDRRSAAQGARQLLDRGQPDQVLGHEARQSPPRRCWASTPTRCWPNWATRRSRSRRCTRSRRSDAQALSSGPARRSGARRAPSLLHPQQETLHEPTDRPRRALVDAIGDAVVVSDVAGQCDRLERRRRAPVRLERRRRPWASAGHDHSRAAAPAPLGRLRQVDADRDTPSTRTTCCACRRWTRPAAPCRSPSPCSCSSGRTASPAPVAR